MCEKKGWLEDKVDKAVEGIISSKRKILIICLLVGVLGVMIFGGTWRFGMYLDDLFMQRQIEGGILIFLSAILFIVYVLFWLRLLSEYKDDTALLFTFPFLLIIIVFVIPLLSGMICAIAFWVTKFAFNHFGWSFIGLDKPLQEWLMNDVKETLLAALVVVCFYSIIGVILEILKWLIFGYKSPKRELRKNRKEVVKNEQGKKEYYI